VGARKSIRFQIQVDVVLKNLEDPRFGFWVLVAGLGNARIRLKADQPVVLLKAN
jgi:hypothetical protein